MTERQVQSNFLDRLKKSGIYYVKIISASTAGHPDCIVCKDSRFEAYEFKSDTGRLSPLQAYMHDKIRANGGQITVVTPLNWQSVANQLLTRAN
jgi:hypothetical protein